MTLLRRCLIALLILTAVPAEARGDANWFYRGSDITPDTAWTFGTLPNGLRYAVRKNALPAGQVSIRVRIDVGSLHEQDQERGWAHLVEHMAFRGTASFADQEARHIWQTLGASFGSDTNASTSPIRTVYQLDLPDADMAEVDQSLHVIAEMMDVATFDPALLEAERKVVLAEKGRRPELTNRYIETSWPLLYAGLKIADRDTIGTDATLRASTAEGLRAFYERWYRPDRATVVVVGDADPAQLEALIAKRFGDWKPTGPAPQEPALGAIAGPAQPTATLAYPGAPYNAAVAWLRPYVETPNTVARERDDLARSLAARILNRRLEAKARGEAAFVNAAISEDKQARIADITQLSVTAQNGQWRDALAQSFAIITDALHTPPSTTEIARELANLRTAATSAVQGEATVKSQQRADQLVYAIDDNSVVATANTALALFDRLAPQMTPQVVDQATQTLFSGAGPRLMLLGPAPVPPADAGAALAAAEKAPPAPRQADRAVSMDSLPKLGPAGKEVSRERIADMDVTIVRFANGSSLVFKQTDYEKGSVSVRVRFGEGMAGLPADHQTVAWAGNVIARSGLADLDLDAMERLLTGRKMSLSFSVSDDAFQMGGATNGTDLDDQLRLLATKLAYPRWDAPLFARVKAGLLESYDLAFSSATARANRELGGFMRGGDPRWIPVEKQAIETTSLDAVRAFFDPLLSTGPIEVVIVGDVDIETAVAAMKKTIAALPPRAPTTIPAASRAVRPPAPSPMPTRFTHNGDKDQAFAAIGWTTFGGMEHTREKRALSLAANMMQTRLFEQLREVEGASYSPSAIATSAERFPGWGIVFAASELRPESTDTFFRIAREVVADLAARPAAPDEFARARNPVVSGIERRLKTNAYWLGALENWSREPEQIEQTRTYASDYAQLTAEEVRAAVARYVTDAGDWSMLVLPAKDSGGGH